MGLLQVSVAQCRAGGEDYRGREKELSPKTRERHFPSLLYPKPFRPPGEEKSILGGERNQAIPDFPSQTLAQLVGFSNSAPRGGGEESEGGRKEDPSKTPKNILSLGRPTPPSKTVPYRSCLGALWGLLRRPSEWPPVPWGLSLLLPYLGQPLPPPFPSKAEQKAQGSSPQLPVLGKGPPSSLLGLWHPPYPKGLSRQGAPTNQSLLPSMGRLPKVCVRGG